MVTFSRVGRLEVDGVLPTEGLEASLKRRINATIEAGASNPPNLVRDEFTESGRPRIPPAGRGRHTAFDQHHPLVLSPDDVWLCIAQGFGLHVNDHSESLHSRIVPLAKGKQEITVRRDHFVKGSPGNDWPGCFAEFSEAIAAHVGKKRDLLVASFSTTGPVEKAASEIALMSALSSYFDFRLMTLCGIPEITLLGTPEDWKSVRQRASVLSEFDLGWWCRALDPVLDQFVDASSGSVDVEFWRSLYKLDDGSGGRMSPAGSTSCFPYLDGDARGRNPYIEGWQEIPERSLGWGTEPTSSRRGCPVSASNGSTSPPRSGWSCSADSSAFRRTRWTWPCTPRSAGRFARPHSHASRAMPHVARAGGAGMVEFRRGGITGDR